MLHQLDVPTVFLLSVAGIKWPNFIRCLRKLVDKKEYTDEHIKNEMT